MGHIVDQHDKLEAFGLAMTVPERPGLTKCNRGNAAVEFAMVLPALAMLVVGGLYTGLLMYSVAGLHSAVEQAARCYSVNVNQCSNASATQTYAQNSYYGVGSPAFTASTAPCGHQVSANLTFVLDAAVASWSIPLTATACYPLSD
jgi:Flp pilus assembly protein TadG